MEDSDSGQRRGFGNREMHKTTCSECGKECEVPFKPTDGRPVYCRECYAKKNQLIRAFFISCLHPHSGLSFIFDILSLTNPFTYL
jgi:CxxC-x17-CxxC domain-containing protein